MEKLFEDFKGISDREYLEKLNADLKGKSVEDLDWLDENNLKHRPFYRLSDVKKLQGMQNLQNSNKVNNDWKVSSTFQIDNENKNSVYQQIKTALNNASEIIVLKSHMPSLSLDKFLSEKKICKDNIFIESSLDNFGLNEKHAYTYFLDPIRDAMQKGQKFESSKVEQILQDFKKKDSNCNLLVDAAIYKNAGANQIQEIAFALQHVVEYLHILSDLQINLDEIVENMHIKMGLGNSLFAEMAKIRVFRYLLQKLFTAYGIKTKASIIGEVSDYQLSFTDPYNNLLRECSQLMAGAMTSCKFIICPSFDLTKDPNLEFGTRMSRNLQHLLKEEAYISKVSDPSAGSYYIENLSADFAEAAWQKFLNIEENGGLNHIYEKGELQKEIEEIHQQRLQKLMKGDKKVVGLNLHPTDGSLENKILGSSEKSFEKTAFRALTKRNLSLSYIKHNSKSKSK